MKKQLVGLSAAAILTFSQFSIPASWTINNAEAAVPKTDNIKKKSKDYRPGASNGTIEVIGEKTVKNYKNTHEDVVKGKAGKNYTSDKKPTHTADETKEYAKGELIVKFKKGNGPSTIGTAGRDLELKNKKTFKLSGAHLYTFNPSKKSMDDTIKTLKATGAFEYVEPNYMVKASAISDPSYSQEWGLENSGQEIQGYEGLTDFDIDVETAWSKTMGSPSVVIGVIDTGTDINHPDFAGNIWTNTDEIANDGIDNDGNGYIDDRNGWDFYYGDNSVFNSSWEDDHGTHVSGTIAANDNTIGVRGVAPNVKIMPLKFLGGSEATGWTSDAILAIEYAKAKGVKILNNSWGGGEYSSALKETIENSGTLFIAAAGNDGDNTDTYAHYPSSYDSSNILSVGSADNNGWSSWFSNYGVETVDVFAPGGDILSTLPKDESASDYTNAYGYYSGTSMATPHVSGIAALIASASPASTPEKIKSTIMQTTTEYSSLTATSQTDGLVNAGLAVGYEPDNDVPGIPLTDGAVSGNVHSTNDLDDVFSVNLEKKEKVKLNLSGTSGTDFDLYVFGPNAKTVHTSENIIAYSEQAGTSNELIEFTAPYAGTYYIDVYAYAGNGNYEITSVQGAQAGTYENNADELDYTRLSYPDYCYEDYCDWTTVNSSLASGGNYATMNESDKTVKFVFNGRGFKYNAMKATTNGLAKVTIDGHHEYFVDLYSTTAKAETAFEKTDLEPGRHTVEISWTGKAGNGGRKTATNVTLDSLEVLPDQVPNMMVEDNNYNIKYGETWTNSSSSSYSGGTLKYLNKNGATAEFTFNGSGIQYYAMKGQNYGLVDVYIDGQKIETANLYSSTSKYQQLLFEKTNLAAGQHTIKLVATGQKDPNGKAAWINIDKFEVINPEPIVTIEDASPHITFNQSWTNANSSNYSGGTLKYYTLAGSTATYAFNGTSIKYIGMKSPNYGLVKVYIDNNLVKTISLYNASSIYRQIAFESVDLAPGNHTIKIESTGQKDPLGQYGRINLDAFEITTN